ncbi:hypothetical protein K438DRAFT_552856 [Mycena galopus ATCC 62051]|nr:hypothetical protein K438DRAFT_552856 [Mycena galopus ATCC 62051]
MAMPDIQATLGPILVGALSSSALAGISNLQTVRYYRSYQKDPVRIKVLVFFVWLLDNVHTAFIWNGLYYWVIQSYAQPHQIDHIPWSISLIVLLTAFITVLVHSFLVHRIFLLSKRNWFMITPVGVLTVFRFDQHIRLCLHYDFKNVYLSKL